MYMYWRLVTLTIVLHMYMYWGLVTLTIVLHMYMYCTCTGGLLHLQ